MLLISVITSVMMMASCSKEHIAYQAGDLSVNIEAGDGWLHDYPLFLGIKKKNPPQIAVWLEDTEGRYLGTLYASKKIATQGWPVLAAIVGRRLCPIGVIVAVWFMKTGFICLPKPNRLSMV